MTITVGRLIALLEKMPQDQEITELNLQARGQLPDFALEITAPIETVLKLAARLEAEAVQGSSVTATRLELEGYKWPASRRLALSDETS